MTREIYQMTTRPRARLATVLQAAKDLVTINDAVAALGVDRLQAAKTLARWQQQGWLKRVGRGLYAPIPLDAISTEQVLSDPWILVPARFDPAYIGGWTAAEYWNMTEQLFRSIFVFTTRPLRARELVIQGVGQTSGKVIRTWWMHHVAPLRPSYCCVDPGHEFGVQDTSGFCRNALTELGPILHP